MEPKQKIMQKILKIKTDWQGNLVQVQVLESSPAGTNDLW